jgi:xanthine dehydrogenase accessory factor
MITPELARRAQELAAAREPFATATVVRTQRPTSVEAGSVALVLADGTIEGFVGGVCAEQSVKAYSLLALQSGEPVLLRILPDPERDEDLDESEMTPEQIAAAGREVAAGDEEGVVTVQNPCLSGGAIEVFIEPAPPAPRVLVVGDTPTVTAALRIGPELGLDMVATDGRDPEPSEDDLALIVAAHGRDELHALRRGLEVGLPYVGLVASDRRGAGVLDELRAAGVAEEQLERIDVPAGIPIGSHSPGEIAVSVLARVVSVRRGAGVDDAASGAAAGPSGGSIAPAAGGTATVAVDPICGMTVAAVADTPALQRDGETVYFCSAGCKAAFEAQGEHAHAH